MKWTIAACVALLSTGCGPKIGTDGVPVKVFVEGPDGKPIPTAVVRHPDEADRHRVNAATGHWEGSVLYMEDGSELVFMPNTTIQLEVSAPGFLTKVIQYDIKKRRNQFPVRLDKLSLKDDEFDEPIIQFGQDKKKSEIGGGAAN